MLPPEEAEAYREQNRAIDAEQEALERQIGEIEAPYREQLQLERLERDFPEHVVRAVRKPEQERSARREAPRSAGSLGQRSAKESGRSADVRRPRAPADARQHDRGARREPAR